MNKKLIPGIKRRLKELKNYRLVNLDFAPGHYYSPIVDSKLIKSNAKQIFNFPENVPGIDLNTKGQWENMEKIKAYYSELPFNDNKSNDLRYYFQNNYYSYSDAIFLYSVLREFKPKNVIEVGSGFSSAVMLDTNDIFFNGDINLHFIEPNTQRLFSLLREKDKVKTKIYPTYIQNVDMSIFNQLQENDILFIDSTHVSKSGSDVNKIIFEILPALNKGVLIHFHDIFYPFEYPENWVTGWKGFGWNETYLLKSFLQFNEHFKIEFFNTYLENSNENWFKENMPKCLLNKGGSIWIRKVK